MEKWRRLLVLLLFSSATLVYVANGRTLGSGDTLPARFLPFSLLRELDADLDEFPFLFDGAARRSFPVLDGVPYFLNYRQGHYVSAYSPAPAILALPIYAGPALAGAPAVEWAARLEKLSAALIAAGSVVCLFWALGGLVGPRWALGIAAIYAFGTSTFSVSSQALWQHGPSQLFLALFLLCLVRGRHDERGLIYAGLAGSAAVVSRALDLLVVLPIVAWVLYTRPHLTPRLLLFASPPVAAILLYSVCYFGSPFGPAGTTAAPIWAYFGQARSLEGLGGILASPARGLFVYSPVLVFAVVGLGHVLRRGPMPFRLLAGGVILVVVVVSQWFRWWGGYTWGPRLLADLTPVLCFFLYPVTEMLDRRRLVKLGFVLLAALSIAIHGLGAFVYDARWDALVDIDRNTAWLWSWREGPLVFYGRQAVSTVVRALPGRARGQPTSAESPEGLAASYRVAPIAPEVSVAEALTVSVTAANTGTAVWLASAPGERGTVRLGWRWSRGGVTVEEGRAALPSDVWPGGVARLTERVAAARVPGDYVLTLGLVSEHVAWIAGGGSDLVAAPVTVKPLDLERVLSTPVRADAGAPTATISTDRPSYGARDGIRLTVRLRNPGGAGKFDGYLVGHGPGGSVWLHDGQRLFRSGEGDPVAWARKVPMPSRATGRFTLPAAELAPGAYRWHVVLLESETPRPVARASTAFTLRP